MLKNILLIVLFISSTLTAQIKINSGGFVAIGTNPISNKKLLVQNSNYSYAIYGMATGSLDNYGIYGRAYNGGYANYAVYGNSSGSGSNKYAGYFSGNVHVTGSLTWASDERLKKNINLLNGKEMLLKIEQINPVYYEFLNETELHQKDLPAINAREGLHIGLLAQEVEKVFPELVIDVVSLSLMKMVTLKMIRLL